MPKNISKQIIVPDRPGPFILLVQTSALPNGTEVLLRTEENEVIGSISIFGQTVPSETQYHQVAITKSLPPGPTNVFAELNAKDSISSCQKEFVQDLRIIN